MERERREREREEERERGSQPDRYKNEQAEKHTHIDKQR